MDIRFVPVSFRSCSFPETAMLAAYREVKSVADPAAYEVQVWSIRVFMASFHLINSIVLNKLPILSPTLASRVSQCHTRGSSLRVLLMSRDQSTTSLVKMAFTPSLSPAPASTVCTNASAFSMSSLITFLQ